MARSYKRLDRCKTEEEREKARFEIYLELTNRVESVGYDFILD